MAIRPISASALFSSISSQVLKYMSSEFIKSTRTDKGNTQISERSVILKMKEIFTEMNLAFDEAGSQQSKDFRNVGGVGLNIEIKKTDSATVYFNDTLPSKDIYYIIIFTGKEYKREIKKNINPQVLFLNGSQFVEGSEWILDYLSKITALKDEFARGSNKKKLPGIMSVYPRPTFKADISSFLVIPSLTDCLQSMSIKN